MMKIAGSEARSGFVSHWYGTEDSDPYQSVTDPEHCFKVWEGPLKVRI
jgi:hypothetical protein